ncbi:MAG: hypothetical protein GY719_32570 [bacterium]|nr:hypothetical protein [bacterium]
MHRIRIAVFGITVCFWSSLTWIGISADPAPGEKQPPGAWRAVSQSGPWVARIDFEARETADALYRRIDVWRILHDQGIVEALVSADEYRQLVAEGFTLALDEEKTRTLSRLGIPLEGQAEGIPGFPCYRTVEETYTSAQAIAAAHPDLATWIDVGDSWQKTQDSASGWDIFVLKLTQSAVAGPKPAFFASFAVHAREYTTAELGTRFAEFLVESYDTDPDVHWLLDHHEVHLMLQSNPDGRKRAETGLFWRKNVNNDYCSNTNDRGADLNRNFDFQWDCCGGSSGNQCNSSYRGPVAASEPEIQVLQDYVKSIFPDQRGPGLTEPAPDDATGVAIDVHASGRLLLWPWGFDASPTPNGIAFATLGRKLAFFNDHFPLQIRDFTNADGDSADYFYGELGVAGFGYELGTQFFEDCDDFETDILQVNIDSLLYAAKVARTPYLTPAGPEAIGATAPAGPVAEGDLVLVTATLDDTRFNNSNGSEPTQTIAVAEAFVDVPPWEAGAVPLAMAASDGTFDEAAEAVEATIDTAGLAAGRHIVFVRGIDSAGNEGVVAAAFLRIAGIFADGFETGDTSAWSGR